MQYAGTQSANRQPAGDIAATTSSSVPAHLNYKENLTKEGVLGPRPGASSDPTIQEPATYGSIAQEQGDRQAPTTSTVLPGVAPVEELANAELAIEIYNDFNRKRLRPVTPPGSEMLVDSPRPLIELPRPPKRVFRQLGQQLLTAATEDLLTLDHATFTNHFLQCAGAGIPDSQAPC